MPFLRQKCVNHELVVMLVENKVAFKDLPFSVEALGPYYTKKTLFKKITLSIKAIIKLRKYIKNNDVETVISFLAFSNFINIICKFLGVNHKSHICIHSTYEYFQKKQFRRKLTKFAIDRLYPFADLIVSVSEMVEKSYRENIQYQCKSIVINNPFDIKAIQRKALESEDEIPSKSYIVIVGRLHEVKRQVDLIKAYAKLPFELKQKFSLLIIGYGSKKNELVNQAKILNVMENVLFIDHTDNPYYYIKHAKVVCLTSQNEAFPMVIPEAMICKTPVISSNCDHGPRDILEDGKLGDLYEVGNIIELTKLLKKHLSDSLFNEQKVELAYKAVQKLDVDTVSDLYVKSVILRSEDNDNE